MEIFYSCQQIAERYGVKKTTVWEWIREGKLEAVRIGKQYRIPKNALDKFERKE